MTTIEQLRPKSLHTQDVMGVLLYHELARVQRYAIPVTLLRITVEYPNQSNADYVEGAKRIVTHILTANLRAVDAAGHYEKDYLAMLTITDEPGAMIVAKRLSKLLYTTHPLRNAQQLELVPFIGLAALPEKTAISVENFIGRSTRALANARRLAPGSIASFNQMGKTTANLG